MARCTTAPAATPYTPAQSRTHVTLLAQGYRRMGTQHVPHRGMQPLYAAAQYSAHMPPPVVLLPNGSTVQAW